ncbi:helix-turn-helix transcriptional regulator [Flaviflexus huanghaiensis]|uniref:helix-turn-helix transcriptional regulator n=1 Tax=Flaviflexus huanghaiensis TaxID=1111473 RepID=UPI0015F86F3A|nr:WYL domain-containing protein [Flaviflexus huanghaiensis]
MDAVDEILARVMTAGRTGVTIGEIARDLGMADEDVLALLRPVSEDIHLEVTGSGDTSSLSSSQNRVAEDVFVFPMGEGPADDKVLDRRAEAGNVTLTINQVLGLLEILRAAPMMSNALTEVEVYSLAKAIRELLPEDLDGVMAKWDSVRIPGDLERMRGTMKTVTTAMIEGRQVHLVYMSESSSLTTRVVDPLAVLSSNQGIILHAYCHLRDDERQFRLDRVLKATILATLNQAVRHTEGHSDD